MKRSTLMAYGLGMALVPLTPDTDAAQEIRRVRGTEARYRVGLMFAGVDSRDAGLLVQGLTPGGAAEKAGVRSGDLITHINGEPAKGSPADFAHLFGAPAPIRCRISRGAGAVEVTIIPRRVGGPGSPGNTPQMQIGGDIRIPTGMEYGKLTVLATINGKGPWYFFVDSGAGTTVFDRDLIEELDLPVTGKQRIGGPSDPDAIEAGVSNVEIIKIGPAEFKHVEVLSWDRSNLYRSGHRPRGVFGIGLFADYLLTFDYPAGQIVLAKGELPPVNGSEIVPFTVSEYGLPTIETTVAGKRITAHYDTGSPGDLGVPAKLEADLQFKEGPKVLGRARRVDADFEVRGGKLDGDAQIAGQVFRNPQVMLLSVLDYMNVANIGSQLMSDFVLTFDQKNSRLRMAKK